MVLACLSEVHDPDLIPQVLYMHQAYSASVPDVAANYVRALLCKPPRKFSQRPDKRVVLSNGQTATELILERVERDRFKSFIEICEGIPEPRERHHVAHTLGKMRERGRIERIGKRPCCRYRLLID